MGLSCYVSDGPRSRRWSLSSSRLPPPPRWGPSSPTILTSSWHAPTRSWRYTSRAPSRTALVYQGARPAIVTDTKTLVSKALKGDKPANLIVTQPEGTLDGETLVVTELPRFEVGERCILFLNADGGVVGGYQGKLAIADGEVPALGMSLDDAEKAIGRLADKTAPVDPSSRSTAPGRSLRQAYTQTGVPAPVGTRFQTRRQRADAEAWRQQPASTPPASRAARPRGGPCRQGPPGRPRPIANRPARTRSTAPVAVWEQ